MWEGINKPHAVDPLSLPLSGPAPVPAPSLDFESPLTSEGVFE